MEKIDLTITILTHNDMQKGILSNVIESANFTDIVIVDDYSEDGTFEYLKKLEKKYSNIKVYQRKLDNFANQKNFAIEKINTNWYFSLDSDEIIDVHLRDKIIQMFTSKTINKYDGFYINRRNILLNKTFWFGKKYPNRQIRIAKKEFKWQGEVHEKPSGLNKIGWIKADIIHHSTSSVKEFMNKMNRYIDLEVEKYDGSKVHFWQVFIEPLKFFIKDYFIFLGFLNGKKGFIYHALDAIYEFLKYARLYEKFSNK
jgi:hypothetical protein